MASIVNQSTNEISFGGILEFLRSIEDHTSTSLFQYTRRSTINSRVYIEKTIAGEPIITDLMSNIMNLYVGLITTAMNMNQYITNYKKVRDAMSVVATEDYNIATSKELLDKFVMGNNSANMSDHLRMALNQNNNNNGNNADNDDDDDERTVFEIKFGTAARTDGFASSSSSNMVSHAARDITIPSGRVIEIKFAGIGENSSTLTVNLFLQLNPNIIPSEVAAQFVALNFTPSIKQRYMQMSAGEISFWRDFVFGQDLRKKRKKALRADKTGELTEMIERQQNSLANSWLKLAFVTPERQNIANTILIFDKNNFDKACSNAGLNWKDYNSRQKFFNKTFAMMLCTVDPMYNKIAMYYHGLPAFSTFTFDQMKKNAKIESTDLLTIMKNYSQGMAPKF